MIITSNSFKFFRYNIGLESYKFYNAKLFFDLAQLLLFTYFTPQGLEKFQTRASALIFIHITKEKQNMVASTDKMKTPQDDLSFAEHFLHCVSQVDQEKKYILIEDAKEKLKIISSQVSSVSEITPLKLGTIAQNVISKLYDWKPIPLTNEKNKISSSDLETAIRGLKNYQQRFPNNDIVNQLIEHLQNLSSIFKQYQTQIIDGSLRAAIEQSELKKGQDADLIAIDSFEKNPNPLASEQPACKSDNFYLAIEHMENLLSIISPFNPDNPHLLQKADEGSPSNQSCIHDPTSPPCNLISALDEFKKNLTSIKELFKKEEEKHLREISLLEKNLASCEEYSQLLTKSAEAGEQLSKLRQSIDEELQKTNDSYLQRINELESKILLLKNQLFESNLKNTQLQNVIDIKQNSIAKLESQIAKFKQYISENKVTFCGFQLL